MKRSSAIGLILASILLALSFSVAFADQDNATLNKTLLENLTNMTLPADTTGAVVTHVNTNTVTIQNISLKIILIGAMINVKNNNMLPNSANSTKNTSGPRNTI